MRTSRIILAGLGLAAIGYAVAGAATDPGIHLASQLAFMVTVVAAHELVLLPVAIGVGALVARLLPARIRGPVQAALVVSAAITVIALPMILGAGRNTPDNPSALPLDYPRGLAIALAVVWALAALVIVVAILLGRSPRRPDGQP